MADSTKAKRVSHSTIDRYIVMSNSTDVNHRAEVALKIWENPKVASSLPVSVLEHLANDSSEQVRSTIVYSKEAMKILPKEYAIKLINDSSQIVRAGAMLNTEVTSKLTNDELIKLALSVIEEKDPKKRGIFSIELVTNMDAVGRLPSEMCRKLESLCSRNEEIAMLSIVKDIFQEAQGPDFEISVDDHTITSKQIDARIKKLRRDRPN